MKDGSVLGDQSKSLVDRFFHEHDQKLIDNLKKMQMMKQTKEALMQVSGITNDKVLDKLVELDIHPELAASMVIVPLVAVAWADGEVDEKEKSAVMECTDNDIFKKNLIDSELIDSWLSNRPPQNLIDAWMHYVEGLCTALDAEELDELRKEIMSHCDKVARASGGLLGIGKISGKEEEVIRQLETAFTVCK
jgi:regulator of sigma D